MPAKTPKRKGVGCLERLSKIRSLLLYNLAAVCQHGSGTCDNSVDVARLGIWIVVF